MIFKIKILGLFLLFFPLVSFADLPLEKQKLEEDLEKQGTFLEKYDKTVWTDGVSTIRFRKLSSINYSGSTKKLTGYVFDGFLKKSNGNGDLYNDQGYFIIQNEIKDLKDLYEIKASEKHRYLKTGVNVRKTPSKSGIIVKTLNDGIVVKVLNKTNKRSTLSYINKETGQPVEIEGRWVKIETYSPTGHRQEKMGGSSWYFVNIVNKSDRNLECHMCGYKVIDENSLKLSFTEAGRGDFGPVNSYTHSFSINNGKMIEVESYINYGTEDSSEIIWAPIDSDPIYIKKIKKKNITMRVHAQSELDKNRKKYLIIGEEDNLRDKEYTKFRDLRWNFRSDTQIVKSPKNLHDFYYNGLIRFFRYKESKTAKVNDYQNSIIDLNKALELISKSSYPMKGKKKKIYYIIGLIKNNLNNIKGACDAWKKAADLGYHTAKKLIRENCD
jgi:hypothetical protein